jgi:hypothetical protein
MKDTSATIAVIVVLLAIAATFAGIVQVRRADAITVACREACFPFVSRQVAGLCYCYTVEGDLRRATKPEPK